LNSDAYVSGHLSSVRCRKGLSQAQHCSGSSYLLGSASNVQRTGNLTVSSFGCCLPSYSCCSQAAGTARLLRYTGLTSLDCQFRTGFGRSVRISLNSVAGCMSHRRFGSARSQWRLVVAGSRCRVRRMGPADADCTVADWPQHTIVGMSELSFPLQLRRGPRLGEFLPYSRLIHTLFKSPG